MDEKRNAKDSNSRTPEHEQAGSEDPLLTGPEFDEEKQVRREKLRRKKQKRLAQPAEFEVEGDPDALLKRKQRRGKKKQRQNQQSNFAIFDDDDDLDETPRNNRRRGRRAQQDEWYDEDFM